MSSGITLGMSLGMAVGMIFRHNLRGLSCAANGGVI